MRLAKGESHGSRDGGSKCVTTGLICVPQNIMILKKSESSRKELSGFFCVFTRMQSSRGKEQKFAPQTLIRPPYLSPMVCGALCLRCRRQHDFPKDIRIYRGSGFNGTDTGSFYLSHRWLEGSVTVLEWKELCL